MSILNEHCELESSEGGTSQHKFSALQHGAKGFCLFLSQQTLTSYARCLRAAFCCISHHVSFRVMVISPWQAKELALSEGCGHVMLRT